MNKHILFVFALIAICTASESLQMKSSNIGKAAAAAQKASDALSFMENANMQVDTLSDQAMSNLEDTNANLSSLQDIANNQESFPVCFLPLFFILIFLLFLFRVILVKLLLLYWVKPQNQ